MRVLFTSSNPFLISPTLACARRCAPGSGYAMPMLKDAIGNAIRCARHKLKKSHVHLMAAAGVRDSGELYENDPTVEGLTQEHETF